MNTLVNIQKLFEQRGHVPVGLRVLVGLPDLGFRARPGTLQFIRFNSLDSSRIDACSVLVDGTSNPSIYSSEVVFLAPPEHCESYLTLKTTKDSNGNSRGLFLVFRNGERIAIVDRGYEGTGQLLKKWPSAINLMPDGTELEIPVKQYKELYNLA